MTEQVGWVPTRSGLLFCALHEASGGTAVVFVPPFGWEAMSSARGLRAWAAELAAAGHPTLRFHPAGTGDSFGVVRDLAGWTEGLVDLVAHTRTVTGCTRLALVGLGLGGVLACQAVAAGADVTDLVLWATPSRGRLLLREIRAFAAIADGSAAAEGGDLWVHGYPLPAAMQDELTALDLTELALPVRRALVLGRGTLPPDARMVTALAEDGVDVTGSPGPGYDELTVEPRLSQPPREVMALLREWLPVVPAGTGTGCLPTEGPERQVRHSPVAAAVRHVPGATLTAVFVGAGATPRSGPNRLWTEAARRWAELGMATVRVDLEGIGEADGAACWTSGPEALYVPAYRPQVLGLLDLAVSEGLPDRFLLVGLCSGGYWAAQAALDDTRVLAVVALNSYGLVWPPPLTPLGSRERLRHLTRKSTWGPLLRDPVLRADTLGRVRRSGRLLLDRHRSADPLHRAPSTTLEVLEALEARGVQVMLGISPGEPLLEEVAALPVGSRTRVVRFEGPSEAHTLAPPVLRAQAEALLDEAARFALS